MLSDLITALLFTGYAFIKSWNDPQSLSISDHIPVARCNTFLCISVDLCGASGPKPLKTQRSLPGTPVSLAHCPIDLRTSMEEKYKEIAEVRT